MSIFSHVESGTSFHRSRFTKSISNRIDYDCKFHALVPVLKRFVLPGDIWRIGGDVLVRFQPMRTPTLTPNNFRMRYFFVPLRLIEKDAELIITGSQNGHLYNGTVPTFDNFVTNADKNVNASAFIVGKHSFWDYMNVQCADYENIKSNECLPAYYWFKAYKRIIWDYYDDENIGYYHNNFADFDAYVTYIMPYGTNVGLDSSPLKKDYFTSSLPWQLKAPGGIAPRIDVVGNASLSVPNFFTKDSPITTSTNYHMDYQEVNTSPVTKNFIITNTSDQQNIGPQVDNANKAWKDYWNGTGINITGLGFTVDDLRTITAQTRIFERLARAGSRYTEYLRANFGTAPADDTLQRAQYLGGWTVPIVTTEVLQTAQGTDPVGTMRGHGITRGGNRISTFYAKEFGLLFGLAEVRPDVQYTTGIPRQLTYKRRFDFFNPSFQHLSEQEVRNGELFISDSDGLNDTTFGFQAYANELRTSQNETVGDLRDTLGDWNQALAFTSRPNLNNAFINSVNHLASFNRPFVIQSSGAYPIIVQFYNNLDVYRPMVRYATPGLVDHL